MNNYYFTIIIITCVEALGNCLAIVLANRTEIRAIANNPFRNRVDGRTDTK